MKLAIGSLSVVLFGLVGGSFWGTSAQGIGVVLMALAAVRALIWFRQLFFFLQPDQDDGDPD